MVGAPTANRKANTVDLVGCFLNNLVIPVPVHRPDELGLWIERARAFSSVPYPRIVEALRDISPPGRPLYDVYLNCRYDLEAERSIEQGMPEAVLDRSLRERLVPQLLAEHFIHLSVDEVGTDYSVKLVITPGGGRRVDLTRVNTFQQAFMVLSQGHPARDEVSAGVSDAILETLQAAGGPSARGNQLLASDSFFALGGNSLLLLKLRRRLECHFSGIRVELAQLVQKPTVGEMEAYVRALLGQPAPPTAVPVQFVYGQGSDREMSRVLVFFPALIGGCACYSRVFEHLKTLLDASSLANGTLVLGLQQPANMRDFSSFLQLAGYFAGTIKDTLHQRHGRLDGRAKIVLVGVSIGALLAYETAMALDGELGVDMKVISVDGRANWTVEGWSKEDHYRQMGGTMGQYSHCGLLTPDERERLLANSWHMLQLRTAHKFSVPKSGGRCRIVLLRARDECTDDLDDYGWGQIGAEVEEMRTVPGNHTTMLTEPNSLAFTIEVISLI